MPSVELLGEKHSALSGPLAGKCFYLYYPSTRNSLNIWLPPGNVFHLHYRGSKEKKHLSLLGRQNSLLTSHVDPLIKFEFPNRRIRDLHDFVPLNARARMRMNARVCMNA